MWEGINDKRKMKLDERLATDLEKDWRGGEGGRE